jgi:hypothetical protein
VKNAQEMAKDSKEKTTNDEISKDKSSED